MNLENQVLPPVRLKGVGDSLWVTIDPNHPVEFLQKELTKIFERLSHLAINARVILDVGQENDCDPLIQQLGDFLKTTYDVGTVSKPPAKPSISEKRLRERDMSRGWHTYRSEVLMLSGRVRSGQKVDARKHLLIMGDVNPGAEVWAGGDIIVMGSLCGTAVAGQPENEEAIVLALDFRPTQVQIGGFVAAGVPQPQESGAEFAHVENGAIVVEDYLKAKPFARLPWPILR